MIKKIHPFVLLVLVVLITILIAGCPQPAKFYLRVGVTEGGAVDPAPDEKGFPCSLNEKVTLTAHPDEGYTFSHWSRDASGTANPLTVTMDRDKLVIANFEKIHRKLRIRYTPYNVQCTFALSPAGTSRDNAFRFEPDTEVKVTAIPEEGYMLDHWSGDASGSSTTIKVKMDADKEITAHLKSDSCKLTILYTPADIRCDFAISPEGQAMQVGRLFKCGTTVKITALPQEGYIVENWNGDASGTSPTVQVTMDGDKQARVHLKPERHTLRILYTPATVRCQFMISPKGTQLLNKLEYDWGTLVSITAIPEEGYFVDHWSGDASGSSPTVDVSMDVDREVAVHLKPIVTSTPPTQETVETVLSVSAKANSQSVIVGETCHSTLAITYSAEDLTAGAYPVKRVILRVDGVEWHDSGTITLINYQKSIAKQVDCGKTYSITVIATNSLGLSATSHGTITTAGP